MHEFIRRISSGATVLTAIVAGGFLIGSQPGRADDGNDDGEQSKIRKGFDIAPVPLKIGHLNRNLVGYGSYLVNAVADCNGCHTSSPQDQYAAGGNPYFSQHPKKVNPAKYLGGGQDFGPIPAPGFADIVTRNITPDKTGKPAGLTYAEFLKVIRTGVDLDKWHPNCSGPPNGHCVPPPFDGSLLLVMPWPAFQDMVDNDLQAIYSYLSAIPCLEGDPGNPSGSDTKGKRCK